MADEQLDELTVGGANRNPTLPQRAKRATDHFAPGTFFPRIKAVVNPRLYRERGDTSRLVDDVFADGGALSRLAASNPTLMTEIRQQSETPMTSGEHEKFRSALLEMVGSEVEREAKTAYQVADNKSFMEAFSAMDGAIPGIADPERDTFEEAERKQIGIMYQQAQQMALLDPDSSKALMADVRKKADALTSNVRTFMEKGRKRAIDEDTQLFASAQEQVNETNDIIASLRHDADERGVLRSPNEALIARAFNALGRAQNLPRPGEEIADTGQNIGSGVGGLKGTLIGEALALGGKVVDKVTESGDVRDLIDRLEFNSKLVQEGYLQNRKTLQERYAPIGIRFGEKAGDVYAVIADAYKKESDKIPAKAQTPEQAEAERTTTLRTMLADEVASAEAQESKAKPEASANMPGAGARLAAAIQRAQSARDDRDIFEDDLRQSGSELAAPLGAADTGETIKQARSRRQARDTRQMHSQIRQGIMEALRGYTR